MKNPCRIHTGVDGRSCTCDEFIHPQPLHITAGLSSIPRQAAGFPEFRRAMLAGLRRQPALLDWRARGGDDLGLMLLEMWAYVGDVLAFYDEVAAHEAYLRTARRQPSLHRLVGLLGYIPRPAVAATVDLVALAEGRQPVTLPKGTAFRSAAFNGQPPQVFELETAAVIHPLANRWRLQAPRPAGLPQADPASLLVIPSGRLEAGQALLLRVGSSPSLSQARQVTAVLAEPFEGASSAQRVSVSPAFELAQSTPRQQVRLETPTRTARLWTVNASLPAVQAAGSATRLTLDRQYPDLRPGQLILVSVGTEYRWFQVSQVDEALRQPGPASAISINGTSFNMPAITVPVTRITLDADLNSAARRRSGSAAWGDSQRAQITVHYALVQAGTLGAPPSASLQSADSLAVEGRPETSLSMAPPSTFALEDKDHTGVIVGGSLDLDTGRLSLNGGTSWQPALVNPVDLYGNVVRASRGESVTGETLGSGDASQANQSFKLKKSPLTYTAAAGAQGLASSLEVWVEGVLWSETPSFFGVQPGAQVYIARQNEAGETLVTFGDGLRGARLPTGRDNVKANYRFGSGESSPPAGALTQLARPVKGLTSVRNPVAASGGADAESLENLRTYAPRSALLLGRAVSIQDMEAAAAGVAGVRAVRSEWRWNPRKLRPVVQIWYVGQAGVEAALEQALRALADPTAAIDVERAAGVPAFLALDIEIDPRYLDERVLAGVRSALTGDGTGLLTPERIGIGLPLFRSRIFDAVLDVTGTIAVRSIQWNGVPFSSFAVQPGAGRYFDLESGGLSLNGR